MKTFCRFLSYVVIPALTALSIINCYWTYINPEEHIATVALCVGLSIVTTCLATRAILWQIRYDFFN